jgi:hypothetical protein
MRHSLSPLFLVCYDGEGMEPAKLADPAKPEPTKDVVTKDQVEKLLAEERKKADAKVKSVLADKEKVLNDLLATQNLTEQQRTEYETKLDEVQKQLHSEKELLLKEKQKLEETLNIRIKEAEKVANEWQGRFAESSINRELQAAAVAGEAVNPKVLVALLKPNAKVVEADGVFKTVVEVESVVDGKTVTTQVSPEEAVKQMKAKPEEYGSLFKSGSVPGTGKNSGAGTPPPNVDVKTMTHEQYMQMRAGLMKRK